MNAMTTDFNTTETKRNAVDRFLLSGKANVASYLTDAICRKITADVNYIKPDGSRDEDMDHVWAMAEALKGLIGEVRDLCEQAEVNGLQ